MNDKNLRQLKNEYVNTPIPGELDFLVKKALKDSIAKKKRRKGILRWAAAVAASIVIFTAGINTSPTFAKALSDVPVVGTIVRVLTFREYRVNEGTFNADIKVPAISGLENKALRDSLNEKYVEENRKLYEQFTVDMKKMKENGGGHLGVNSGYVVKTDTERLLSVGRYVVNTVGSSSTTFKYDTIDKKKEVLVTLPSLFKDERYIDVISENVKMQMIDQMKSDPKKVYWIAVEGSKNTFEPFEKISENQNFYINAEGKLVISFNKYEVAPGYMGVVEFVIPTEAVQDIVVGNEYIKK